MLFLWGENVIAFLASWQIHKDPSLLNIAQTRGMQNLNHMVPCILTFAESWMKLLMDHQGWAFPPSLEMSLRNLGHVACSIQPFAHGLGH